MGNGYGKVALIGEGSKQIQRINVWKSRNTTIWGGVWAKKSPVSFLTGLNEYGTYLLSQDES